jgi:hypothetical protein
MPARLSRLATVRRDDQPRSSDHSQFCAKTLRGNVKREQQGAKFADLWTNTGVMEVQEKRCTVFA